MERMRSYRGFEVVKVWGGYDAWIPNTKAYFRGWTLAQVWAQIDRWYQER